MTAPSELREVVIATISRIRWETTGEVLRGRSPYTGREVDELTADAILALPALSGCGVGREEKQVERIATAIVDLAIERPEDARRSVKAILALSLLPGGSGEDRG